MELVKKNTITNLLFITRVLFYRRILTNLCVVVEDGGYGNTYTKYLSYEDFLVNIVSK